MDDDLERLARSVYAELSAKQQPIPDDIAAAVYGNLSSLYMTADEKRCRWPECNCYAEQGRHECKRLIPPAARAAKED